MTGRRALSELLVDVGDGVLGFAPPPGIRPTSMVVGLPVEIEVAHTPEGPEFRAELPRFVTRTSFDPTPGRLTVRWAEE